MRAPLLLSRCAHGSQHGSPAYARLSAHARLRRLRLPPPTALAAYGPLARSLRVVCSRLAARLYGPRHLRLSRSQPTHGVHTARSTALQPTHGFPAHARLHRLRHGTSWCRSSSPWLRNASSTLCHATPRPESSALCRMARCTETQPAPATLRNATPRYAMLCYATLAHATLRHATLRYATLRYATQRFAMSHALRAPP